MARQPQARAGSPAASCSAGSTAGVRGITSNPTIFQKAIEAGDRLRRASSARSSAPAPRSTTATGTSSPPTSRTRWRILRPVYDASDGVDGFVSVEVAPSLARDTDGTDRRRPATCTRRIDEPNLYVKIPGTAEGLAGDPADDRREAQHQRHAALLRSSATARSSRPTSPGSRRADGRPVDGLVSVASFFVSRVDTEVDRRLDAIGTDAALALEGKAAVANAQLAYELFLERFSGPRWEALAAAGARVQRPLWASTSTKNPAYPDTLYVDALIGPDTVNTMPDATLDAFDDHGTVARTIDADLAGAQAVHRPRWPRSASTSTTSPGCSRTKAWPSFSKSFDELHRRRSRPRPTELADELTAQREQVTRMSWSSSSTTSPASSPSG